VPVKIAGSVVFIIEAFTDGGAGGAVAVAEAEAEAVGSAEAEAVGSAGAAELPKKLPNKPDIIYLYI